MVETIDIVPTVELTVLELTNTQKQRYAHFLGIYSNDQDALKLVQLLDPRGENSWKKVTEKIDELERADYKMQMYHDMLYENFDIDQVYSVDSIIRIVGIVRRDMGLPTYLSSLKRNCLADFLSLFIIRTVSEDICCIGDAAESTTRSVIYGYKPLFRLKSEE